MRVLFVLILIGFSLSAKAQLAFPDSSAEWNHCCVVSNGLCGESYSTGNISMFLYGDTIVGGESYTKVCLGSTSNGPFSDTIVVECLGGLRESLGRVYYVGRLGLENENVVPDMDSVPNEMLLYDFNASVGDTILNLVNYHVEQSILEVDSVFSVVFERDSLELNSQVSRSYRSYTIRSHWGIINEVSYYEETNAFETHGDDQLGLFGPLKTVFESGCIVFSFTSPDHDFNRWSPQLCATVGIEDPENVAGNCLINTGTAISNFCDSKNYTLSIINMLGQTIIITDRESIDYSGLQLGFYTAVLQTEIKGSVLKFAVTH